MLFRSLPHLQYPELAQDIGDVEEVIYYDQWEQEFVYYYPKTSEGENFNVRLGYPYLVLTSVEKTWPV